MFAAVLVLYCYFTVFRAVTGAGVSSHDIYISGICQVGHFLCAFSKKCGLQLLLTVWLTDICGSKPLANVCTVALNLSDVHSGHFTEVTYNSK